MSTGNSYKYSVVSIVTPSFNQGKFIEETIKSVISQEGDFYLDYIIVDGGSTDNSLEIIKKYDDLIKEGRYPIKCKGIEYRWVSEPDKGQSDAINKGFRMAKGEIIAYLNSDDTYNPGAISKAIDCFMKHPAIGVAYGDNNAIDEFNNVTHCEKARGKFNFRTLRRKNVLVQPAVFVRRKVLEKVGYLDTNLYFVMDYDWYVRISRYFKGKYIPFVFANFRQHSSAKTDDEYLASYRAEYLLVIKKYGGDRLFSKALGENIIQITKNKFVNIEKAFGELKSEILSKQDNRNSESLEQVLSAGYAYAVLRDAFVYAGDAKRRAKENILFVFNNNPSVLFGLRGFLTLMKLILPYKFYLLIKCRKDLDEQKT